MLEAGMDSPTYSRTLEQVGDLPAGSELVLISCHPCFCSFLHHSIILFISPY